ncbi:hypothetical protein JXM67_02675 [candidate division WOR-3 bacterium]|nr:hypothetical protein [candidate division WOR-3 bacterium]
MKATENKIPDLARFRDEAILALEELKKRYLEMVKSTGDETTILERAARLLPGLIKTEENLLTSIEESKRHGDLDTWLEPLFSVLRKVLGLSSS